MLKRANARTHASATAGALPFNYTGLRTKCASTYALTRPHHASHGRSPRRRQRRQQEALVAGGSGASRSSSGGSYLEAISALQIPSGCQIGARFTMFEWMMSWSKISLSRRGDTNKGDTHNRGLGERGGDEKKGRESVRASDCEASQAKNESLKKAGGREPERGQERERAREKDDEREEA
eukprot:466166-Pleurochrysis_carterae.AAC.1